MGRTIPFQVTPLDATFGAVVTGLDLSDLDEAVMAALYAAWLDHALLIFPGLDLDDAGQTAFARRFGELELELHRISNLDEAGQILPRDHELMQMHDGNYYWHCDSTFRPVQAKGAVFSARIVPSEGGETAWTDLRAAWEALPEPDKARIEPLAAYHSLAYSQGRIGRSPASGGYGTTAMSQAPILRPLVKVHPETGRRSLNIGRHAHGIPGMAPEESERFLDDLTAFASQPPRVWTHRWTAGDAVIWDNRCLMHRALSWDQSRPRDMRHTRLAGGDSERGLAA